MKKRPTSRAAAKRAARERQRERVRLLNRWRVLVELLDRLETDMLLGAQRGVFTSAEAVDVTHAIGTATEKLHDPPPILMPRGERS
jgi:hypothetical protein